MLQRYKKSGASTWDLPQKELLPLTPADLAACDGAWDRSKDEEEVMVNALGMKILRKDLRTLKGLTWLNDEVGHFPVAPLSFQLSFILPAINTHNNPPTDCTPMEVVQKYTLQLL